MEIDPELLNLMRYIVEGMDALDRARAARNPEPLRLAVLETAIERKLQALSEYYDQRVIR